MSVLTESFETAVCGTLSSAWAQVDSHSSHLRGARLSQLLADDSQRFAHYSLQAANLLLDYSKNILDDAVIAALLKVATTAGVAAAISQSFAGAGEHPMTGYIALRMAEGERFNWHGIDHGERVLLERKRCGQFAEAVRNGRWLGESGRRITDVVNIGVGGSDLGPQTVTAALREFGHAAVRIHFVSSMDSHDLFEKLAALKVESTLFVIASKSFKTQTTLANADAALAWFKERGGKNMAKHFVAVSANTDAAHAFGIAQQNLFPVWDWVSGRFSFWCANGLTAMISIGAKRFDELLAGARAMDKHFRSEPLAQNMPVLLALIDAWYAHGWNFSLRQTIPTHYSLRGLPDFIEHLAPTHQVNRPVSGPALNAADFIITVLADHQAQAQHQQLIAHSLGQSRALMMEGNSPSNTILMAQLSPATLGALIALYEHKAFVSQLIMGGAEGTANAQSVLKASRDWTAETAPMLEGHACIADRSTAGLVHTILQMQAPSF